MRKHNVDMLGETQLRPRKRYGRTVLVVLLLAAFPLAYEGSLLCVAQWKALFGRAEDVRTPVLDFIGELVTSARQGFGRLQVAPNASIGWKTEVVIPLAIVWTGLGVLILRRC